MAEELTPVNVAAWTAGNGTLCWMVTYQRPDGSTHGHVFPQSTVEWRIAEYQLTDFDEALDIVLHEPWATNPQDPAQARDDAAVKAGMVTRVKGPAVDYEPIRLHNADSIDDARAAHRLRIADAKSRTRVVPPKGKADPIDTIRAWHGVTEEGVREKAARVAAARRAYQRETAPARDVIFDPAAHTRTLEVPRA